MADLERLHSALSLVSAASQELKSCVRHNSPVLVEAGHLSQDAENLVFGILGAINKLDGDEEHDG